VPDGASQIRRLASPVLRMGIDDVPLPTNVLAGRTWSGRESWAAGTMSRKDSARPESTAIRYAAAGQT
jgi:hypothetical protein